VKRRRRPWLQLAAGAAIVAFSVGLPVHGAWSQTTRTTRVVVPFPPGGTMDTLARLLTEQIGRAQGQTMVVENRPGGGSVIGTEAVARAAPDGNTVLMLANSFVINPHLKRLNYDPLTSFEPICYLVRTPNVIAVNTSSPHRTLGDLLGAARMKPGDLTLASVGPATTQHIAIEVLKRAANVNMTYVPFPGDAPAVNALLGEHVASILATNTAVSGQVQAGKLRVLAVASGSRIESLPDLPTVAESGFKHYEADVWFGLVAPAKTPKDVVSQLAGWFSAAMRVPEVKAKLVAQGLLPVGTCGEDFAVHLRKQYDEYGRVICEAGIKAE
jgi:tripartite-type tricarboxylate transporter receptor subunit TctC